MAAGRCSLGVSLLGASFVFAFFERRLPPLSDAPGFNAAMTYFSFSTLTTVGYGDIVPVHPIARSIATLESIIGLLFPATLLARIVTLEAEARHDRQFRGPHTKRPEDE